MSKQNFTKDDSLALTVTLTVNILFLLFSLWFTIDMGQNLRPAFLEVEFGEFQSGKPAEFSEVKDEQVAKRPNPSEVEPEEPKEEAPVPEEEPQKAAEDNTKPVDLPDEQEEVEEDPVETTETEKVDPTKENTEEAKKEVEIPPVAEKEETTEEGAKESGDQEGAVGDKDADQGTGNQEDKTSPYELKWDGEIDRAPMVQPLPKNTANMEGVITVRFEVRPDGSVGRVIPLKKMNPELEREVMSTLRSWRFSRLPSGVPQQAQWGTITFRFVFD
ncbi:MAG: TonB family protein [Balneolaceae bacterium]|nr:TonB family protein [Balneolaceae bacterium]